MKKLRPCYCDPSRLYELRLKRAHTVALEIKKKLTPPRPHCDVIITSFHTLLKILAGRPARLRRIYVCR